MITWSSRLPINLTRRGFLVGSGVACASAAPSGFSPPPHACDCHTHIFEPDKFPYFSGRTYTPPAATPDDMAKLHTALHIERVVIVTPSVYGTDNSATLYGMKARGKNARGVAVIADNIPAAELNRLHAAGIRGIRLNLSTGGQVDAATGRRRFQAAIGQVKPMKWHIQMFASLAVISGIRDLVMDSETPVVFDHFGGLEAAKGMDQPGFADLAALVRSGKAYVKLSGAYRASTRGPDYQDVIPFAKALIAANADRVLWGSDWPHPNTAQSSGIATPLPIDDNLLLSQLSLWAPDEAVRKKILVDNPARLYEF